MAGHRPFHMREVDTSRRQPVVPPRSLSHCQRDLLQEAIGFYVGGECCEVHMGSVWKDQRYGTDFERAGDARSLIN